LKDDHHKVLKESKNLKRHWAQERGGGKGESIKGEGEDIGKKLSGSQKCANNANCSVHVRWELCDALGGGNLARKSEETYWCLGEKWGGKGTRDGIKGVKLILGSLPVMGHRARPELYK